MKVLIEILSANVWPLAFLFVFLVLLKAFRQEVQPLFLVVRDGLKVQAGRNSVAWAVGGMVGTLASLQAMSEVGESMHWPYVAAGAKILQPGLAAVLGYIMKSPSQQVATGTTNPPFPIASTPPAANPPGP